MANIFKLTAAFIAVFFTSNFAYSIGNDNPTGEADDELFDYAFGQTPAQSEGCLAGDGTDMLSFVEAAFSELISEKLDQATSEVKYILEDRGTGAYVEYGSTFCVGKVGNATFRTSQYSCLSDGSDCGWSQNGALSSLGMATEYGTLTTTDTCPPDSYPTYTTSANVGAANYCFDPADIQDRDSCPDSSSDGDYVLPLGSNTSSSICQTKEDGSSCAYTSNGDYYVADFEGNCYESGDGEEYESPTAEPEDENECVKMGTVWACKEDPEDKCSVTGTVNEQTAYSSCESGCGYADPLNTGVSTFVCLSDDADNNGIPDSKEETDTEDTTDPEDPEDPTDPEEPTEGTDVSGIESRLDTTNGLIGQTNSLLGTTNTTLGSIETETKKATSELEKLNTEQSKTTSAIGEGNDKIDELTGVTTQIRDSLTGEGTTFSDTPSTGLVGFYTPEYENGFQSVWEENEEAYNNSSFMEYIAQWEITVSGTYEFPQFCFDLGIVNFGCQQIVIDPRVLAFIRVILIFSALILARQITLGG